jgi:hypothetical protein
MTRTTHKVTPLLHRILEHLGVRSEHNHTEHALLRQRTSELVEARAEVERLCGVAEEATAHVMAEICEPTGCHRPDCRFCDLAEVLRRSLRGKSLGEEENQSPEKPS